MWPHAGRRELVDDDVEDRPIPQRQQRLREDGGVRQQARAETAREDDCPIDRQGRDPRAVMTVLDVIPLAAADLERWEPAWRGLERALPGRGAVPVLRLARGVGARVRAAAAGGRAGGARRAGRARPAGARRGPAAGGSRAGPVASTRGLLAAPGDEASGPRSAAGCARTRGGGRRSTPRASRAARRTRCPASRPSRRRRRCSRCPASLDEYLAGRSRYRRILRRLARDGRGARARREDTEAALADFVRLHAARAARKGERHPQIDARLARMLAALRAAPSFELRVLELVAGRPPARRLDRARARRGRLVLQPRHRPGRAPARARHRAAARVDPRAIERRAARDRPRPGRAPVQARAGRGARRPRRRHARSARRRAGGSSTALERLERGARAVAATGAATDERASRAIARNTGRAGGRRPARQGRVARVLRRDGARAGGGRVRRLHASRCRSRSCSRCSPSSAPTS